MSAVYYADDSTVYKIGDSFDSLIRKTNFELGKIDSWLCANKFSLNMTIAQFFMFNNVHYNNSSALQIRAQVLPQCSHTKFLGIVIDDKLSFLCSYNKCL